MREILREKNSYTLWSDIRGILGWDEEWKSEGEQEWEGWGTTQPN